VVGNTQKKSARPYAVMVEHVPGKAKLREFLRATHSVHLESAREALIGTATVLDEEGG